MLYEVFDYSTKRDSFVVITDWGDKKKSEEEAIRFAANYYFKIKKDRLKCFPVYMTDKDADTVHFSQEKGTKKFLAVGRK